MDYDPLDFESDYPLLDGPLVNPKREKVTTLDDLLSDHYKKKNEVVERESKRAKTRNNSNSNDDDDDNDDDGKEFVSRIINECEKQVFENQVPFQKSGFQTMDVKIEEFERESKRAKTCKNSNSNDDDDDDNDNGKEALVSRKINECHEQVLEKQVVDRKSGLQTMDEKIEEFGLSNIRAAQQDSERDHKLDQILKILTETRDNMRAQEHKIDSIEHQQIAQEKSVNNVIQKFAFAVTNSSIWNTKALQVILCEFQRQGHFTPEGNRVVQAMNEELMKNSHEMWKINNALLSHPSPSKYGR
ncbi:hypothetical protein M5689_022446 [Euphorbia peplus]|nr:hypothetical protein M5689_022446 [Euphorbia peplus]